MVTTLQTVDYHALLDKGQDELSKKTQLWQRPFPKTDLVRVWVQPLMQII